MVSHVREVITLSPRLSPDGTRVAVRARPPGTSELAQVWATRRNMSMPPTLAAISNKVFQAGRVGQFTVSASDPESDSITYGAFYLQLGMSFNPVTRTFSWTPPASAIGHSYNVKFLATTPSGGSASQVVIIAVIPPIGGPGQATNAGAAVRGASSPSSGPFVVLAPPATSAQATLDVFNSVGRLVAHVSGPAGVPLTWNARSSSGYQLSPGVYFYAAREGSWERKGKWVLVR